VLTLIEAQAENIDWDRLIHRLGPDAPLLAGALSVFAWLDAGAARSIPARVWDRLGLRLAAVPPSRESPSERAALLDSRPWFRGRTGP
jgi:hypothetical protein